MTKLGAASRMVLANITDRPEIMDTTDRPKWLGLLSPTDPTSQRSGFATPKSAKRNMWVVVGFFGLIFAAWINSQM